jgi:hypothetical protein
MLGLSQCGSQLRAASKRVGTFAGLDLDELTGQRMDDFRGKNPNSAPAGMRSRADAVTGPPWGSSFAGAFIR